jgi:hypothetical protein
MRPGSSRAPKPQGFGTGVEGGEEPAISGLMQGAGRSAFGTFPGKGFLLFGQDHNPGCDRATGTSRGISCDAREKFPICPPGNPVLRSQPTDSRRFEAPVSPQRVPGEKALISLTTPDERCRPDRRSGLPQACSRGDFILVCRLPGEPTARTARSALLDYAVARDCW